MSSSNGSIVFSRLLPKASENELKSPAAFGRLSDVLHAPMTFLSLTGSACLAISIASADLGALSASETLRESSRARLQSAETQRDRIASRVHHLESLAAGLLVADDTAQDLRSIVLDVASEGTGFGVRSTHPLLEQAGGSVESSTSLPAWQKSWWHRLDSDHRGPVAAFGLTLIFASVLSGGAERKIHAVSPLLDDTLPVHCSSSNGESTMSVTTLLSPDSTTTDVDPDREWKPAPMNESHSSLLIDSIDDEEEGDLFYFDDEEDDQDEDEDDGFFFDDDDDDDDDDQKDGGGDVDKDPTSPDGDKKSSEDSEFGEDEDEEEYEFED